MLSLYKKPENIGLILKPQPNHNKVKFIIILSIFVMNVANANECIDVFYKNIVGDVSTNSNFSDIDKSGLIWQGAFHSVKTFGLYAKNEALRDKIIKSDFEEAQELCYKEINKGSTLQDIMQCYSYDLISVNKHIVSGELFPYTSDNLEYVYTRVLEALARVAPPKCNAYYLGVISQLGVFILTNYKKWLSRKIKGSASLIPQKVPEVLIPKD